MNISIVFSYLLGLIILYLVARLLLIPESYAWLINGIIGGLLLAVFNIIGSYLSVLAINPITVLVAGLGIPAVLLAAIRYIVIGG